MLSTYHNILDSGLGSLCGRVSPVPIMLSTDVYEIVMPPVFFFRNNIDPSQI